MLGECESGLSVAVSALAPLSWKGRHPIDQPYMLSAFSAPSRTLELIPARGTSFFS